MPRNTRNFWIEGQIDGRNSELSGGPRNKDGGISVKIKQRNNKGITEAIRIDGIADSEGNLSLKVYDKDDNLVHENKTKRWVS